jgi:inner membrane protein
VVRPRLRPAPPRTALPDGTFRRLVVVSLAVGSNLPDVDVLYTTFAGDPLAYVLHHRGYTHTLIGALIAAVLYWLACLMWLRHRRLRASGAELGWIAAAAVIGVLLHLAMDYTNSYGVHPFWPFYNGWVYGDSVFIVEPLIWLAAAPLIFLLASLWARSLVAVLLALMTVLVVVTGWVATPAVALFVVLAVMMIAVGRWLAPAVAITCGIALWLSVTAAFALSGRIASQRLQALAQSQFPQSRTLDRVLTPEPADPICWEGWLVQAQSGEEVMRQVRIALLPGLIAARDCRGAPLGATSQTAGGPVAAVGTPGMQWLRQYAMPADRIARLATTQCRAREFMQFARVPLASADAGEWWLGDLRFGGGRGRAFSQVRLTQPPQPCNGWAVPWLPPRPELQKLQ